MKNIFYKAIAVFIFLLLWESICRMKIFSLFILPSPTRVIYSFISLVESGELVWDILISTQRVLVGFFISVCTAIPLGLLLGTNPKLKVFVAPIINLIRPIPPIAWIPLAIMWFGIGNPLSYFVTMIASFFPIFINTLVGVENVNGEHLEVAKCFGADKKMVMTEVIFPSALPYILSGIRIGLGISWMAVNAAEMIASYQGLGYFITINQQMLRSDRVVVGMIMIGCIGLLLDTLLIRLRSKLIVWNQP